MKRLILFLLAANLLPFYFAGALFGVIESAFCAGRDRGHEAVIKLANLAKKDML